jgi:thermostable 8-oxoguanine DNA glycosylase
MDKHIIKELKEIWDSRNIDLKKKSYLLYENE